MTDADLSALVGEARTAAAAAKYYAEFCRTTPQAIYMTVEIGLASTVDGQLFLAIRADTTVGLFVNNGGKAQWLNDQVTTTQLNAAIQEIASARQLLTQSTQDTATARAAAGQAATNAQKAADAATNATNAATNAANAIPSVRSDPINGIVVTYDATTRAYTVAAATALLTFITAQAANRVLAGPDGGSNAVPTFRVLSAADLPAVVEFPLIDAPTPKVGVVLGYYAKATGKLTFMYPNGTKTEFGGA